MKQLTTLSFAIATALSVMTASAVTAKEIKPMQLEQVGNPMSYSFALKQSSKLDFTEQRATSSSNEYHFTVSGAELNKGINLHTTIPGALIKISRADGKGDAIDATELKLTNQAYGDKNLVGDIITEDNLKATGVFPNSAAIKLNPSIKAGSFKLAYGNKVAANNQFVINVKEKYATSLLKMSANSQSFLHGQNISFDAKMVSGKKALAINNVDAHVIAPSGKKTPIAVTIDKTGVAKINASQFVDVDAIESPINGLYELHLKSVADDAGLEVHRSGKIAFALSTKTATLEDTKLAANNKQSQFKLDINQAGRYEVRGVLYGHDAKGQLKPIMETHAAQDLPAGLQVLTMNFDQNILRKSGLKAPYQLKHVRLFDQTRMSKL